MWHNHHVMTAPKDDAARFWSKVERLGSNDCWRWLAAMNHQGYGVFQYRNAGRMAHRVSYELTHGPIPDGLVVDHLCRNRSCMNPAHLDVVTPRTNTLRSSNFIARHAIAMHCPQGHPYDTKNTYHTPSGGRDCRTCRLSAVRRWRARSKSNA